MRTETFICNGHTATVILPENPNGKWIWKTEFFYAFDKAEQALLEQGYTRVYYQISDKYGSPQSVRKMHAFHLYVTEKYNLQKKAVLFGFSRGGLYAFNYALFYPEYVDKLYLDAPVMDMKSWPPKGSIEQGQVFDEFALNADTLPLYKGNPVDNLDEFFSLHIPTLLIAGGVDEVVPFSQNGALLVAAAKEKNAAFRVILKPDCGHHPHSLDDVSPIIQFVNE